MYLDLLASILVSYAEYAVLAYVDAVFCHGQLTQMVKSDMAMVLLNPHSLEML
jgi:hypothetical protein